MQNVQVEKLIFAVFAQKALLEKLFLIQKTLLEKLFCIVRVG